MEDTIQSLLQKTWHCALMCENCAAASIKTEQNGQFADCIQLSLDCAEVCMLLSKAIKRQSMLLQPLLDLCHWICQQCAEVCGKHEEDHCQQCAAACLLCSEACLLAKSKNR
ncbi:hypothetical protein SAMN05421747_10951 [Parapedobacter composti]|uniref:Four-helix bundle copper-binding protein n=1 Tax=Parapedobacter composti TaxID=623281 RepID=A0A1I1IG18_9SPHI|nr:hypothetical protein SAMN05421747_10951 [Parapedobacter composti]